ncbi:MAG: response regulator [Lachnospiraceae bacterium]|nr:response regulator [Lachnospiraceae bacterium]
MPHNFLILDNDPSMHCILSHIIMSNKLGNIVCSPDNDTHILEELRFWQPEIALVDLQYSDTDVLSLIQKALKADLSTRFIAISHGSNSELIRKAYEAGIEFVIKKPVIQQELVHVIRNIQKMHELEQTIAGIRRLLLQNTTLDPVSEAPLSLQQQITPDEYEIDQTLNHILSDIGIIGMTGTRELKNVVLEIRSYRAAHTNKPYHLRSMYSAVCQKLYGKEKTDSQQKNMEQRIRRAIQHAFLHLAELGAEDYYDPVFTEYAPLLFDFSQIRQEMRHLKKLSEYGGKINAKKFFEGMLIKTENRL